MARLLLVLAAALALLGGCVQTVDLRVENVSDVPLRDVRVGGQAFGDVAPGAVTGYRAVRLRAGYVALAFRAAGHRVTGQTWTRGASPVTYRLRLVDAARGRLTIDIVRD